MSDQPHDPDARLRRLLGDPEPGDEALLADPEMHRVMAVLDDLGPEDQLDTPPVHLWDAIAAGAGLSGVEPEPITPVPDDSAPATAPVVPLRRSGPPPWWLGAAAAVAVVVVVAVGALAIAMSGGGNDDQQIAAAELDVLVDADAHGSARLVQVSDADALELVLDIGGLDDVDGFYEVWLLTPEVDGLVSLGPLRNDGRYQVPAGLDPARFSVVDVSVEPHDGDPSHSGNSVLRGALVEA